MKPTIQLHDTMSGKILPLAPSQGETYRMYCCGPTVYGPAHIGNFRSFLVQDVLRRVLELTGLDVLHVRNITDVDDKTIRESQAEGKSLTEFTDFWTERFHADCTALNMLPPHREPGAVAHMPDMIQLIQTLVDKGLAYQAEDGSVYYRISKFESYGRLSRLDKREITTADAAQADDEYDAETAADFALWKARKPEDGENFWDSPWGEGRPGWHIECSAMSLKYLGTDFDLHGGGVDLTFPHHENEIAQSEGAMGCCFARHWFHSAHLMVNAGKMSKSLGNLYTLNDIQGQGFDATELRYALIAGHYRKPLNYTDDSLHAAHQAVKRLRAFYTNARMRRGDASTYQDLQAVPKTEDSLGGFYPAWQALLDQLNVPKALGEVFSFLHDAEKLLANSDSSDEDVAGAVTGFDTVMAAMGLDLASVETDIPEEVTTLAERRLEARRTQDWAASDELRDQLKALGWQVNDAKDSYELEQL